jgi:lipid II:glycine glycyltransferase (peptidoglycan interpeptide bridge formation enzyme)
MLRPLVGIAHDKRVADLEIRSDMPAGEGIFPLQRGYHHHILLPSDPDDLHVRKSYRHLRNKARTAGVAVRRGESRQDVDTFYRLHAMTRRRHGVPVQPKRFFDLIARRLVETGNGFVLIAEYQGRPAAAGLFLSHKDTLVTKFAASDPAMRDVGAGHLVDWTSLDSACRNGYRVVDWGRTDSDAEGLRSYKLGWGAVETELVYTHLCRRPPQASAPHVNAAARSVIQHSPEWVCRMLGELLYRGAA